MRRILFWDHYDAGMGGIEKMIITLASDLAESHEIVVIARKDGTICEALRGVKAKFIRVDPDTARSTRDISCDDLLIEFGTFRDLQALSVVNPRLLLWRVFPSIGCRGLLASLLCRRMFITLEKLNSLVFMDKVCHQTACRELKRLFAERLLPIPILVREKRRVAEKPSNPISITYIGRGRLWKVKPVKKLAGDLRSLTDHNFHLHIFTDANELFEAELREVKGGNVAIYYHYGYAMESLSQKLLELSDLHYSMGTACLEGAVLGIPTIIADASYKDFPVEYGYRWLIDDIENYAGVFLEKTTPPRGHALREVVNTLHNPQELRRISETTYAETVARFGSRNIAQAIEKLQPQARVTDLLKFMPSYWRSGRPFVALCKRMSGAVAYLSTCL
ncbi:MAG TPA: hypothetical protein P5205_20240 [Candidatus Paceibacterota bacterium]|nr:hypothetical protein [Verrucomicrobiota bacterium]HSA12696.1 hypothetical protein [Candidatus Paceibacterota bacterium]